MSGGALELTIPQMGDFKDVAVIDILVKPGDSVALEDGLITLETDKATMDVPATAAGTIEAVLVQKGQRVSPGTPIVRLRAAEASAAPAAQPAKPVQQTNPGRQTSPDPAEQPYVDTITLDDARAPRIDDPAQRQPAKNEPSAKPAASAGAPQPAVAQAGHGPVVTGSAERGNDVVVLGGGPGGYTAAFRAADLGMRVTLIERMPALGGVCLNVGCIPSKALLHAARVIEEAHSMSEFGIEFGAPRIDLDRLRAWKSRVVARLTTGLSGLARQRKVEVVRGNGRFLDGRRIEVESEGRKRIVEFSQCIIAAGSESVRLPGLPDDPRIIDSTGALELPPGAKRLLVIGGGIIGLEMACVYDALGAKVSVVELSPGLMPGCDRDLVRPLEKRIGKRYEQIMLNTRVERIEPQANGLKVIFGGATVQSQLYDYVLVAVGRAPNGHAIDAAAAGVAVDQRGFIKVDKQLRTSVSHIFAIGDIVGQPMLAHKASHEGKVAAEVAAGHKRAFEAKVIPSVAYTDPEIAWVGLTETQAQEKGIDYGRSQFPWAASGRSLALNRDDGFTKILFDKQTQRVLGGGIVGTNAGDLISELGLAIEMGCDAADIGLTVHPHPTLSETIAFAAEAFEGTLTDLYMPKK